MKTVLVCAIVLLASGVQSPSVVVDPCAEFLDVAKREMQRNDDTIWRTTADATHVRGTNAIISYLTCRQSSGR